jgi:hypothetical protein
MNRYNLTHRPSVFPEIKVGQMWIKAGVPAIRMEGDMMVAEPLLEIMAYNHVNDLWIVMNCYTHKTAAVFSWEIYSDCELVHE